MGWRRVSQGRAVGDEVREGPDHRDLRGPSIFSIFLVQMGKKRPRK